MEVRNRNGDPYNTATMYGVCAGIQRYVREKRTTSSQEPLDIYKDPYFRSTFDTVLKDLGIGLHKRQAEVISEDIEERLWNEEILGDDTLKKLLDTLVFCLGMNLALRSGKEHRSLRPDMLKLHEASGVAAYLEYTESGSKNNPGGLKHRKVQNKSVKIYANSENPRRCVVQLFKKYMSFRPSDAPSDVFYLQPIEKPNGNTWYRNRPLGHNPLSQTVKKLVDKIGVNGFFTNHSLRRTCATRLYNKGIDEQQIMSVTGHRSVDGVRVYKQISCEQQQHMSKVIQPSMQCTVDKKNHASKENSELGSSVFNFHGCTVTLNCQ